MADASNLTLYVSFFFCLYFEVFLLIHFLGKRSELSEEESRKPSVFPSITVIVPAFNEEKTVAKTVFSLLKLDYPKDKLKIMIVNDGSTDGTAQAINRFRGNKRISIITKKNGGKYTALNAGIARANTDLVGCLDADSFVPPDTLQKIVPYFENEKTMAVTPAIKIHQPNGFIRNIQSNEYNLGIFMKKAFSMIEAITVTPGPFSIFRKAVFENIGLFKEAHNTEDLEIAMRMQKNFYKIRNAHTAVVYTVGPGTIRGLFKQRVRWIYGFLANTVDYRALFFKKKYGHLGVFTLPMGVVGIFFFFMSVGFLALNTGRFIYDKISEMGVVGVHIPAFQPDWFFMHADSKIVLGAILFAFTVVLITVGKTISEKRVSFSFHTLYFPFIYGFLSIFWLSRAVYNLAFSKGTRWR